MNKHLHRIVFNQNRGQMMVVAESATAQGKAASGERTGTTDAAGMGAAVDAGLAMLRTTAAALRPVCLGVFASLGLVLLSAGSPDAAAQVVADPNAPANQRPTVLNAGNGVPVVNIQTPSAAGVSRNTYKQFDVNGNGVILNNSRTDVQTQLGGFVQGNPWLATGSARVILNEVNSSNPSQLRGYIEVGGQKAEVIIANPAGVAIDGAGFINASRVTITTGNTQVNGGSLEGYLVQRGQVSINGKGLDTSTAGYTAILARAVQVNGGIWAKELNITTGANQISASEGSAAAVTSAPGSVAGQGAAPLYALDVSALGGMYAGKILLIGTESGVGVSNAGTIGAGAGQVQLSSEGLLTNSGTINSTSNLTLDATGGIRNSGTVYAATNTSLTSQGSISNSGLIAAAGDTTVQASGTLAQINNSASGVMAAGLAADGKLGTTGNLTINAQGTAQLAGRSMAGNSVNVTGAALDLSAGQLSANSLILAARTGDINATGAALSSQTTLQASTTQTLRTDGATVAADQLKLTAKNLSNVGGQIIQTGVSDTTIALAGSMDNSQGRIATNSANLTLSANNLNNTDGKVEHAGSGTLAVNAASLSGARGTVTTANILTITSADLNNDNAHIEAKALTVNAGKLSNQKGDILQTGTGAASITATAALNNAQVAIISNGDLNVAANSLNNQGGAVQATGTSGLKMDVTNKLDNSAAGTLSAGGQAALTAGSLSNDSGRITAGTSLVAMVAGSASNQAGLMAATQTLSLNAASLDNTRGTLASVQSNASVTTTGSTVNDSGRIEAAQAVTLVNTGLSNTIAIGTPTATNAGSISGNSLNINTQGQTLNNTSGTLAATSSAILNTGTLNNDKGAVQSGGTLEIDTHGQTLTNTAAAAYTDGGPGKAGGISAQGTVTLRTGTLNNAAGFIGANGALTATTGQLNNAAAGEIISTKTIVLTTTGLGNQSGKISGSDNVTLNAGTGSINNTGGLLASNAALSLSAASVVNTDTISLDALKPKGMEAASVAINATSIDNQRGSVRADQSTTLTSAGSINNSAGTLSAGGTVVLQDTSANKTLAITNTAGNVLADQQVTINAASLTGDGTVQSTNNLAINLTSNFANSGQVKAGNNATITTTADLTNSGKLQAGNMLAVNAANIHNTATGDIAGGTTRLTAVNTLTNRGVIDGSVTALRATTVNNLGTGSIYGDDISIAATTLNNDAENGKGAAIAARNSLHIGAANVLNREGSLMFSAGDMAIGGSIDANGRAQGYASNITNASATIDVLGDLDIKTANLLNTNLHFSTTTKTTSQASGIKLLYGGVEYSEDQVGTNFGPLSKIDEDAPEWRVLAPSAEFPASQFPMDVQSWAYPLTISLGINNVSRVPYKIALSGYPSNHIIWSKFGIAPPSPAPVYAGVLRCDINGNNCIASDPASYNLYRTAYNAWLVTANQANAKLAQKAQAYNDSIDGRLLRDWTTVQYTETTVTPEVATTKPAVMTVGGNLSGVFTQSATNDKSQIIAGGNNLLSGLQISNLPPVLDKVAIRDNFYTYSEFEEDDCGIGLGGVCDDNRKYTPSTTRTEVRTPVPLEIYKVEYNVPPAHTDTDPKRSLLAGINAASAVGGKPLQVNTTPATPVAAVVPPIQTVPSDFPGRVIRTTTPNLTLPNNALFTITTSPTSAYLVETDPRFANYRQWLGSDYLLNALSIDPTTVQKRLGDGFYEQKLIREQIALLTGRRFTGDFTDDTTQYMALMNSGATYAKTHKLRPGVALAAQASVSFINNGGNLGAVLNELGSKDSVKGLLTAMVTAGALNGLSSAMGGVTATGGTPWSQINATSPFVDQLQKNLVNQLTSNVLQTALTGGNSSDYEKGLQTSLLTAFISTGAAQGANAIGDMQANGSLNALPKGPKAVGANQTGAKTPTIPADIDAKAFAEVYSKAPAAKAEIDQLADAITKDIGGQVAKAPIKSEIRAIEKISSDYSGDVSQIKDLAKNANRTFAMLALINIERWGKPLEA
jgi:filamentous hemagglutinin